jgi:hypothetical protein
MRLTPYRASGRPEQTQRISRSELHPPCKGNVARLQVCQLSHGPRLVVSLPLPHSWKRDDLLSTNRWKTALLVSTGNGDDIISSKQWKTVLFVSSGHMRLTLQKAFLGWHFWCTTWTPPVHNKRSSERSRGQLPTAAAYPTTLQVTLPHSSKSRKFDQLATLLLSTQLPLQSGSLVENVSRHKWPHTKTAAWRPDSSSLQLTADRSRPLPPPPSHGKSPLGRLANQTQKNIPLYTYREKGCKCKAFLQVNGFSLAWPCRLVTASTYARDRSTRQSWSRFAALSIHRSVTAPNKAGRLLNGDRYT